MNDIYPVFADAIQTIAVYALPLLFGITMHVAAQCYLAHHFGDRTAKMLGRLSLNPMKHIDPIGTIAVPIICFIVSKISGFPIIFGYAKPLPIDFGKLPNPKRDMLWIALVGVASNFAMAVAWLLLGMVFRAVHFDETFFVELVKAGINANLILLAVYLIPLPPFDGGRIVFSLLPAKQAFEYAKIEPYSMLIVFVLLMANGILVKVWLAPLYQAGLALLNLIALPLNLLFN